MMINLGYRNILRLIFSYMFLIIFALLIIFPLLNVFLGGFKTNTEIYRGTFLPSAFTMENFKKVVSQPTVLLSFVNSILIAAASLAVGIIVCSLASYGIARRKERIFGFFYYLFLAAMVIPPVSSILVLYSLFRRMGLTDTRLSLILIYSATLIPMGILLYTSFMKTIPKSLDEAAKLEGAGYLRCFFTVQFPLIKPITAAFAILRISIIWNDFLMPLTFLRSEQKKTITLMIYNFTREYERDSGAIFALLILALLVPILFFIFGNKQIYRGITAGAVKG